MQGCACKSPSIYIQRSEPLRNCIPAHRVLRDHSWLFQRNPKQPIYSFAPPACDQFLQGILPNHFYSDCQGHSRALERSGSLVLQEHLQTGHKGTLITSSCFQTNSSAILISSLYFPFNKMTDTWKPSLNKLKIKDVLFYVKIFRKHTKVMGSSGDRGVP